MQLTWKSGKAYWYQTSDFNIAQTTTTPLRDGWGATFDNATNSVVLSDGSPTLSFVDPATLKLRRSVQARPLCARHVVLVCGSALKRCTAAGLATPQRVAASAQLSNGLSKLLLGDPTTLVLRGSPPAYAAMYSDHSDVGSRLRS